MLFSLSPLCVFVRTCTRACVLVCVTCVYVGEKDVELGGVPYFHRMSEMVYIPSKPTCTVEHKTHRSEQQTDLMSDFVSALSSFDLVLNSVSWLFKRPLPSADLNLSQFLVLGSPLSVGRPSVMKLLPVIIIVVVVMEGRSGKFLWLSLIHI